MQPLDSSRTSYYTHRIRHANPQNRRARYTENGLSIEGNTIVPDSVSHLRKFGFIQYKNILSDTKSFENYKFSPKPRHNNQKKKIKLIHPPQYFSTFIEDDEPQVTMKDINIYKTKIKRLEDQRKEQLALTKTREMNDNKNIFTNFISAQNI